MQQNIQYILPALAVLLFFLNIFYRGNTVESYLTFILALLPLMDLKVTIEAYGGFKVFDVVCYLSFIFLFKDFITINLNQKRNDFYFGLVAMFLIIMLIGGLASEFPGKTYLNVVKALPIFIFARFLMTEAFNNPEFYIKAIRALKVSYVTALIFLALQVAIGLSFTFYPGLSPNTVDPVFHIIRYPGIFYDSQAHGQYLAIGAFLFLYVEEGSPRKIYIQNYLVFGLAIVALYLAGSRSAFGGFLVGAFVVFMMAARKYAIYACLGLAAAYAIITALSVQSGVIDRAGKISEDLVFRQSIWKEAFDISQKHPWLGIGTGNYQNYVIRHNQDQYLEVEDGQLVYFDQPENGYLKIMVEMGFIGFGIFALFILVPLFKGLGNYLKGIYDRQVAFFMGSIIAFLVAFNTVYSIYDYRLQMMLVSMIVLIVAYPVPDPETVEYNVYPVAHEQEV